MTSEFRPLPGRVLAAVLIVACVIALAVSVFEGGLAVTAQIAPWVGLVVVVLWALFWNPRVVVADSGVRLVNVWSTVDLPWPAIERIETRWALTLVTAYGTFTAWAAPAPGGMATTRSATRGRASDVPNFGDETSVRPSDLKNTASGAAAAAVRSHWEELQAAGYLDDPRLEFDRAPVTWHWPVLAVAAVLTMLGLLAAAFA